MHDDLNSEIRQLSNRLKEAPDSRLFAPLADAYRKSGQMDKAIALCEEGLVKYPDYASAHVILGKCYYDKGATERSKAEFELVLDIDSENMVALKFLGDILMAENDFDGARKFFDRLLMIDPTNEEVLGQLKEMEKDFKVRDIDLDDEKSVKRVEQPKEMATMTLAGIYASQGYYDKALRMYKDIIAVEPGNREAARMIEKLGSMIDSSEKDRGEAFEDEVLTISVDDVGKEIIENSSGHGTSEGRMPEDEGDVDEEAADEIERPDGGDEETRTEEIEKKEDTGPAKPEQADEKEDDPGEHTPEEMDHFQQWLRKMKGSDN